MSLIVAVQRFEQLEPYHDACHSCFCKNTSRLTSDDSKSWGRSISLFSMLHAALYAGSDSVMNLWSGPQRAQVTFFDLFFFPLESLSRTSFYSLSSPFLHVTYCFELDRLP